MARVTVTELADIFDTDLDEANLETFIDIANRFVTRLLGSSGLAAADLKDIELFLAAHFASLKDPRVKSESLGGDWSYTVQGVTGESLRSTFYGQQALMLDTTGLLDRAAANTKRASITALTDLWDN